MDSYGHHSSNDSAVLMKWDKMLTAAQVTDSRVFSTWEWHPQLHNSVVYVPLCTFR